LTGIGAPPREILEHDRPHGLETFVRCDVLPEGAVEGSIVFVEPDEARASETPPLAAFQSCLAFAFGRHA
jgi:hypothetical protein